MRHGSLFSGIGGFDLAAERAGFENVFQVEIDGFCQKVLRKNFPNVKKYKDIKEFDGTEYRGAIDVISGDFPCQPFSIAGKQKGAADDRNFWPEMFRIIKEIRPSWIVGENVANIINFLEFENLLFEMETEGYEVQAFIIPAAGIGAKHKRERIWIVANTEKVGRQQSGNTRKRRTGFKNNSCDVSNTDRERLQKQRFGISNEPEHLSSELCGWWETEPDVGRVANGISNRVDRIKGLGNAIVPQVAFRIFKSIRVVNDATK